MEKVHLDKGNCLNKNSTEAYTNTETNHSNTDVYLWSLMYVCLSIIFCASICLIYNTYRSFQYLVNQSKNHHQQRKILKPPKDVLWNRQRKGSKQQQNVYGN